MVRPSSESGAAPLFMRPARQIAELLAPAGNRSRLSIFIYHRVRARPDPLFPEELDAERFDRHLRLIAGLFNVIRLDDAARCLTKGTLPARPACITFDDGYADNAAVALPLLQRSRLSATFFISSGYLDGGRMWNDTIIESVRQAAGDTLDLTSIGLRRFPIETVEARRATIDALLAALKYRDPAERSAYCDAVRDTARATLPDDLMLSSVEVRALHDAGMDIGAHTVSHPILTRIPRDAARREIADGRDALQAITGSPVSLFAYPNGKPGVDYGAEQIGIVRELGFDAAVSTGWGVACTATDRYQLPRFTPWDRTPARIVLRVVRNLTAPVKGAPT